MLLSLTRPTKRFPQTPHLLALLGRLPQQPDVRPVRLETQASFDQPQSLPERLQLLGPKTKCSRLIRVAQLHEQLSQLVVGRTEIRLPTDRFPQTPNRHAVATCQSSKTSVGQPQARMVPQSGIDQRPPQGNVPGGRTSTSPFQHRPKPPRMRLGHIPIDTRNRLEQGQGPLKVPTLQFDHAQAQLGQQLAVVRLQTRLQHLRITLHVVDFAQQDQVTLAEQAPTQQSHQRTTGFVTTTRHRQDERQVIVGHRVIRLPLDPLRQPLRHFGQRPETVHAVTKAQHPGDPLGTLRIRQPAQVPDRRVVLVALERQLASQPQRIMVARRTIQYQVGQLQCTVQSTQPTSTMCLLQLVRVRLTTTPPPPPKTQHDDQDDHDDHLQPGRHACSGTLLSHRLPRNRRARPTRPVNRGPTTR